MTFEIIWLMLLTVAAIRLWRLHRQHLRDFDYHHDLVKKRLCEHKERLEAIGADSEKHGDRITAVEQKLAAMELEAAERTQTHLMEINVLKLRASTIEKDVDAQRAVVGVAKPLLLELAELNGIHNELVDSIRESLEPESVFEDAEDPEFDDEDLENVEKMLDSAKNIDKAS